MGDNLPLGFVGLISQTLTTSNHCMEMMSRRGGGKNKICVDSKGEHSN